MLISFLHIQQAVSSTTSSSNFIKYLIHHQFYIHISPKIKHICRFDYIHMHIFDILFFLKFFFYGNL